MDESASGVTIVVGAGLSGLAAAATWRDRGENVVLLEGAPHVGGMSVSVEEEGFTFDLGPHFLPDGQRFHTPWIERVFSPDEMIRFRPRIEMIVGGRRIRYPFSLESLNRIPFSVQAGFLMHRLRGSRGASVDAIEWSFRKHMSDYYGSDLYEYLFRPYITKKFGRDVSDELHRDWWAHTEHIRGEVVRHSASWDKDALGQHDQLWGRMVGRVKRLVRDVLFAAGGYFVTYPRGGFGQIAERLADDIEKCGVDVRLNTEVMGLKLDEGGVTEVTAADETIPVRRLIWTGSPIKLAELLGLEPPSLPTLHLMVFFVRMDKAYPRSGTEVRPCDAEYGFFRGYFPEMIHSGLTPQGRSALVAEVGTMEISDLDRAAERYDQIADSCVSLGLCSKDGIVGISHRVIPNCYPFYTLDYEKRLQGFYGQIAQTDNLLLAGRNARFQYQDSPNVLRDGARTIDDELF